MPASSVAVMPATASSPTVSRKSGATAVAPDKKYKCQFCNRAFSRSEHRSRHERSHTKERPFKCMKCRSTFVRRDLLLRHDRTVHAKDGGEPLVSEPKRRAAAKGSPNGTTKAYPALDAAALEQLDGADATMIDGDLEAAAMLMTDFHQKAMANSQEPESAVDRAPPVLSAGANPLLEPQTAYPAAAAVAALQSGGSHMPWDAFMPRRVSEQKSHSIASNYSTTQESGATFSSVGTSLPAPSSSVEVAPSLQQQQHASRRSPDALAGYPSMVGPVSPVDYRKSPGPSQPLTMAKAPQLTSDAQCARVLDHIRDSSTEIGLLDTLRMPSMPVLNRYLSTYFNLFHPHLPFLHPASFDPVEAAAPLLLAVLSIGALYTFEQDHAFMFHIGSKVLVNEFLQKKESFSSRKCPLWTMQSTLLNMIFASWSGDPKGLEWACSIKSLLANMVAGNKYELKHRCDGRQGTAPSHEEWIEDEGCRRTYYAVYIYFGLLTLTYNHTPAINFNELEDLELPASESLWAIELSESDVWHDSQAARSPLTFKDAHDQLFQGQTAAYSALATRVMINALFLGVWYHKRSHAALQDVVTEYKLRLALDMWQQSLDHCEPETVVVHLSGPYPGHPLIFNALAMYRNTRARLLVDLKNVQEALRYHDSYEVAAAMTHARENVKRSAEMIKVVQECHDCIEVAAKQGIRWVARTSATNWSVEHPLCGMDMVLILTLWLYRLEHDDEPANEEELAMYNKLRNLFDEETVSNCGVKLSSVVARLWGSMIDEVVVWGITKLMGEAFKLHAQALAGYEDDVSTRSGTPTPALHPHHRVEALEMQAAY